MGTVAELRETFREKVQDPDGTYWTDAEFLKYINNAQREWVARTKCLRKLAGIRAYENRRTYILPEDNLELLSVTYGDGDRRWDLGIKTSEYIKGAHGDQSLDWEGTPQIVYQNRVGQMKFEVWRIPKTVVMDDSVVFDNEAGAVVSIVDDDGVAFDVIGDGGDRVFHNGTHYHCTAEHDSTGDNREPGETTLTVTATAGFQVGEIAWCPTTGAQGIIAQILAAPARLRLIGDTGETWGVTVEGTTSGSSTTVVSVAYTDNWEAYWQATDALATQAWAAGFVYVPDGEYGAIVDLIEEDDEEYLPPVFEGEEGAVVDIDRSLSFFIVNHVYAPATLVDDTDISEIPFDQHEYLLEWCYNEAFDKDFILRDQKRSAGHEAKFYALAEEHKAKVAKAFAGNQRRHTRRVHGDF